MGLLGATPVSAGATTQSKERPRRGGSTSPAALAARGVPGSELLRLDGQLIGVALATNLLGLALPMAMLQVYDRVIPAHGLSTLAAISIGLVAVAVAEFFLRSAQSALLGLAALRHSQLLHVRAVRAVSAGRIADAGNQSAVVDRFNAIDRLSEHFGGPNRMSGIDLPFAFIFLGAIAAIGGVLVIAPIIVFLVFLMTTRHFARRARDVAEERDAQDGRASDFFGEAFSRTHTVKSLGVEPLMLRRFERLSKRTAELQRDAVNIASDLERAPVVFGNLSSVATLALGAFLVIDGLLTIGGLAASSLLAGRAIQPLLRVAKSVNETQKAAVAADQVARLFATPEPTPPSPPRLPDAPPGILASGLAIETPHGFLVRDASFEVAPGELAFVLGADGRSRSRLLREIAGMRTPGAQGLTVAGVAPAALRAAETPRVCLASASDVLFTGTILQNLTLFGRAASVADARWACEAIGLERRIRALPAGYDTKMAQGASETLSAGFIQGINLARALARRPRLLLLDEPFSYLDADFAAAVLDALKRMRGDATVVVAAGQAHFASAADQLLVFGEGAIESRSPAMAADLLGDRGRSSERERASDAPSDLAAWAADADAEDGAPQTPVHRAQEKGR